MATETKSKDGQVGHAEVSQHQGSLSSSDHVVKEKGVHAILEDGEVSKENGETNMSKENGEMMGKNQAKPHQDVKVDQSDNKNNSTNGDSNCSPSNVVYREKEVVQEEEEEEDSSKAMEKSGAISGLNEHEKKALAELRSKLEAAILANKLLEEKQKETPTARSNDDDNKEAAKTQEKAVVENGKSESEDEEHGGEKQEIRSNKQDVGIDSKNISLWGVPLLPSKGHEGTDIILLKFLRAREFKADDAFEMLRNSLQWRKENKIDSILEEDLGSDYDSVAYMSGVDRQGHPVCYNVYGVFGNNEMYNKTFGTEESRSRFLRWRLQMMEREIQKLSFKPDGVSSLLQISDLKNTPGPARKDLRTAMKQAVALLQDNYPEFVATNIFINVPFWYYAFNALLSPFLTQRTKSKFVFTRPAKVTETLLKYISAEQIPVHYGGLKRENDPDFSIENDVSEVFVKAGSIQTIDIPAPEVGKVLMWDLIVQGWEVNYKEEFVPSDEGSYTIIVTKERRIGWQIESVRNSYKNNEAGKVVITIENNSFKKKRILYRFKTKTSTTTTTTTSSSS